MNSSSNVSVIGRAAIILRCMADGYDRVSKIAEKTGLSSSTTHRLLKNLQDEGFVVQDPLNSKYELGPLITALSLNPLVSHPSLVSSAKDGMDELRDLTGETVALVIRVGNQRMQLEELPSPQHLKYTVGRGFIAPIHAGATGKVLLAEMPTAQVDRLLDLVSMDAVGPNTITDRRRLLEEVGKAKRQGYATSFGEIVPGASSLAVPIHNYFIPVAMCILASAARFDHKAMKKHLPRIMEIAKDISNKLLKVIS